MSKAYLQFSERYPEAANGYSRVLLGDGTTLADVFDPITGAPIANPVPINADGFVGAYHVENGTVYNIKIYGFLGNLVFERESVTVPGDATGTPGTNGKSVRVQAVTGGAQVYDEFGNTVTVLDGPAGPTGPAGATGATGPAGATGATGSKGADGIAGYIQLPALPVDPSTVPIGQPVILPDGTFWTNVTGSWTTLAVSEAMLDAALAELVPVDAVTDGSTKAVTSNAVFDGMATKVNLTGYPAQIGGASTTADYFLTQTNFDRGLSGQFYYYLHEYELAITANDLSSALGKAYVQVAFTSENGDVSVAVTVLGGDPDVCDRVYYKLTTAATIQQVELGLSFGANTVASARLIHASGSTGYTIAYFTSLFVMSGTKAPLVGAVTAPAGDSSQAIATTAFVGKPSGSVITLSSSQTITPANGAVYYVSGSYDITLSNSSALGTRCYIQVYGTCPQGSRILFTDVAGNSGGVGFGYGSVGAGGVMCERFADGWMVVGGDAP